jgi:hypothetical protein
MAKLIIKKVPPAEGWTGEYVFSLFGEVNGVAVVEGEDFESPKVVLEQLAQMGAAITGANPEDVVVHLSSIVEVTE